MTTIPMEDVMPRRLALSILALAFAVACRGGERADDASMKSGQPPTLRQLAMAWSGGQTRPQCQDRGPNGEYLGPMREQYCVWSTSAAAAGEVSARTTASGRLTLLQWNRQTAGESDADRVVDSLRTALVSHGLVARDCPSGEVPAGHLQVLEWAAPTLLIQLSRISPPNGAPRLMVLATDLPKAVPDIMCPHEKVA
jgi:hypothetical protein